MPTGYTHAVQDGKITTLREFAMYCARAFGATITMRDEPMDAPIPEQFQPDTRYYDEQITKARAVLDELPRLGTDECERRAVADHANKLDSHRQYARAKDESRARYEAMVAKVEAWQVPPEIAEMRQFMLEQLRQSIEFDCSTKYSPDEPQPMTGEAWRNTALSEAARDLVYGLEHREKEIERTANRNQWLAALRASLASPSLPETPEAPKVVKKRWGNPEPTRER